MRKFGKESAAPAEKGADRDRSGNGWLRGMASGLLFSAAAFVMFSLIGDGFVWDLTLLNNTAIGMAAGLISGIIAMLIRRN